MVAGQSPPGTHGASKAPAATEVEVGADKTTGRSSPATHRAPNDASVWVPKAGPASARRSRSVRLHEKSRDPVLERGSEGLVDVAGKHRLTSTRGAPLPTLLRDLGQGNVWQRRHQCDPSPLTTSAGSEASRSLVATYDSKSATLSKRSEEDALNYTRIEAGKESSYFRARGFKSVTWAKGARSLVANGETTVAGAQGIHGSGDADESIRAADKGTGHSREYIVSSAASPETTEDGFVVPFQDEEYSMAKLIMASRPELGAPSSDGDGYDSFSYSDSNTNSVHSDNMHTSYSDDDETLAMAGIAALLQNSLQRSASARYNSEGVHGGGGPSESAEDGERNGAGMRERADLPTPKESGQINIADELSEDTVAFTAKRTARQPREHDDSDRALVEAAKGSFITTVQAEHRVADVVAIRSVPSVSMRGGDISDSGHDGGEDKEEGSGTEVATHLLPTDERPAQTAHNIQQEGRSLGHEPFSREIPNGCRRRFTSR